MLAFALALALPACAQHFVSGPSGPSYSGGFGYGGGWGGYGSGYADAPWSNGYGYTGYDSWGYLSGGIRPPQEHAPFAVSYAHGDSDFVPSQYMDWEAAVALGKQILAQQAAPQVPLGEIARQLRRKHPVPPPASSPTQFPAKPKQT